MDRQNLYRETVEYLLYWYDYNRRILPWREEPKPYHVWVSEIMLQQTRVEAVKFYFDRFLTALPSIRDLAKADEELLLKLWEGLGYYNRVRNLKKAAQVVVETYQGELPADYEALLKLPGIGSYTAGAIASIAFGLLQPAVDGNVLRVMKRIAGSFDDITKPAVKKELEEEIRAILPKERPGDYNQALMELGATVCIPNGRPLCENCPVMHLCQAFAEGTTDKIPVKPPKKERRLETRAVFLLECGGKYLLHKRAAHGLLAGLWELPNVLLREEPDREEQAAFCRRLEQDFKETGLTVRCLPLKSAKHIFSHVEWHMNGYRITVEKQEALKNEDFFKDVIETAALILQKTESWPEAGTKAGETEGYLFLDAAQIRKAYSLPSAFETYRKQIEEGEVTDT